MALWKKLAYPLLSQKGNEVPLIQKVPKKFEIFPACSYKAWKKKKKKKKKISPSHKKIFVGRWEFILWKIRVQVQSTRNVLEQGTKSEKL